MKHTPFIRACSAAVATIALWAVALPAAAASRSSYVDDGAGLLSASTIANINTQVGAFQAQTGKEVVVVTVPSLDGTPVSDAVEKTFAQKQVNGVLIFLAKAEKQGRVVGDRASTAFFPQGTFGNIYDGMRGYLRSGDYDTAVQTGVNLTLDQYRSHARPARQAAVAVPARVPLATAPPATTKSSFGGIGLFWLFVLLIVGFFVIRAIFRAMSGPRQMPPGYGGPLPGPGGPMPGPGFGYGPGQGGPGYGGGGNPAGGFLSGVLGGLGGAYIGNQIFGNHGETNVNNPTQAGMIGGDANVPDSSGWQSDAGQADMGGMGGGGWGDSGGGGDWGGGGADSGGDGGW